MMQPPHNFILLRTQSAVAPYRAARGDVLASPWSPQTTTPWGRPSTRPATKLEAAAGAMSPAAPAGDNVCAAVVADGHPRARLCCHRALARLTASRRCLRGEGRQEARASRTRARCPGRVAGRTEGKVSGASVVGASRKRARMLLLLLLLLPLLLLILLLLLLRLLLFLQQVQRHRGRRGDGVGGGLRGGLMGRTRRLPSRRAAPRPRLVSN